MGATSASAAIEIRSISKVFRQYHHPLDRLKELVLPGRSRAEEFWAVRDVSFSVPQGSTVGVIGRNGSGKSTLLQMVAGVLEPTAGEICVQGRIGALLELGSGFNPDFTGRENVYLNAQILGLTRAEVAERFAEIEAFAGIGTFIDQPVKTYSSGMVVRLAFAVSVHVQPQVLIVDEALAVGDMAFQFKCMERIDALAASGTTVFFVSHDLTLVRKICDQVAYLVRGELRAFGPVEEVTELYLQDLRAEQLGAVAVQTRTDATGEVIGFGTAEGRILSAWFERTRGPEALFGFDEQIEIGLDYELDPTVLNPYLTLLVQDPRLINLTGIHHPLPQTEARQPRRLRITLPARLAEGRYGITLRLSNRLSRHNFYPIDKRVGMLQFQLSNPLQDHVAGFCDLGARVELLPPQSPSVTQ